MASPLRSLIFSLLATLAIAACGGAPLYFPDGLFSGDPEMHQFKVEWYSKHLRTMDEDSLCCSARDVPAHRLLWLRTFEHPVVIRVEGTPKTGWWLHTKVTSGAGGYEPGTLIADERRPLSAPEAKELLDAFRNRDLWSLPTSQEVPGLDGARWIFELRDGERYHLVDRRSPASGDPIRELGLLLMKASGRDFGEVY